LQHRLAVPQTGHGTGTGSVCGPAKGNCDGSGRGLLPRKQDTVQAQARFAALQGGQGTDRIRLCGPARAGQAGGSPVCRPRPGSCLRPASVSFGSAQGTAALPPAEPSRSQRLQELAGRVNEARALNAGCGPSRSSRPLVHALPAKAAIQCLDKELARVSHQVCHGTSDRARHSRERGCRKSLLGRCIPTLTPGALRERGKFNVYNRFFPRPRSGGRGRSGVRAVSAAARPSAKASNEAVSEACSAAAFPPSPLAPLPPCGSRERSTLAVDSPLAREAGRAKRGGRSRPGVRAVSAVASPFATDSSAGMTGHLRHPRARKGRARRQVSWIDRGASSCRGGSVQPLLRLWAAILQAGAGPERGPKASDPSGREERERTRPYSIFKSSEKPSPAYTANGR
jgi:hypothetical protein